MAIFVEHLTATDLRDPTNQRGRLVEDVFERISEAEGVSQCAVRQRIRRELRQQGITYELLLSDHTIMRITQRQPAVPPSAFDEQFAEEEVITEKYTGTIGNPYEAKPTAAMMALLRPGSAPIAEATPSAVVHPHTPPIPSMQE